MIICVQEIMKFNNFVPEFWVSPEQDGDIFYVDGFDPFLGLNIFCNLWGGKILLQRVLESLDCRPNIQVKQSNRS